MRRTVAPVSVGTKMPSGVMRAAIWATQVAISSWLSTASVLRARSHSAPTRGRSARLGRRGDARQHAHRIDRVVADRQFFREHHAVGAVEDRVGDVGRFGAGRPPAADHRQQHLGRGDRRLAVRVGLADQLLLRDRDALDRDLDAEIAARDHDAVGGLEDLVDRGRAPSSARSWRRSAADRPPRAPRRAPRGRRRRFARRIGRPRRPAAPTANSRHSLSRSVKASIGRSRSGRLMPLLDRSRPPAPTTQCTSWPSTRSTRSCTRPSLRKIRSPALTASGRPSKVVEARVSSPVNSPTESVKGWSRCSSTGDRASGPMRSFGPGRSAEDRDALPDRRGRRADRPDGLGVARELAMGEVEPGDVHPGLDHLLERAARAGRGTDGRDDLGAVLALAHGSGSALPGSKGGSSPAATPPGGAQEHVGEGAPAGGPARRAAARTAAARRGRTSVRCR